MTVRRLTQEQKEAVLTIYKSKTKTITEMARSLNVSTRTIGRVIEQAGLATPVARLRGEAHAVMTMLDKWLIKPEMLRTILEILEDAKMLSYDINGEPQFTVPAQVNQPDIFKFMTEIEETKFQQFLSEIIQLRTAKQYNTNVLTAMKKLENKLG